MTQRLKLYFKNTKIWIYLGANIGVSLVLAFLTLMIDTRQIDISSITPQIMVTSVELAKDILVSLAGSLLTITTFTFSTILVVLTMYSSSFSPRVVENFLLNKISMRVLGLFVGGFLYCIISLFFMRKALNDTMVVSASVAVVYVIVCILHFILFVYSVSSSIQAEKLIKKLYDEAHEIIEERLTFREKFTKGNTYYLKDYKKQFEILSDRNGYVEIADIEALSSKMVNYDATLVMHSQTGTFISKNYTVATLYYNDLDDSNIFEIRDLVMNSLSLGSERTIIHDFRFAIQKISEIALRAISPGINDPNTAIHCIKVLGVLTGEIYSQTEDYILVKREDGELSIVYKDLDLEHEIFNIFYQIIFYGKEDISVVKSLYDALMITKKVSRIENLPVIEEYKKYLYDKTIKFYDNDYDLEFLNKLYSEI